MAFEMMFNYKAEMVLEAVRKSVAEFDDTEYTSPIRTKADVLTFLSERPAVMEILEGQLPKCELAIGVATLCALIILHRDRAIQVLGPNRTIDQITMPAQNPQPLPESVNDQAENRVD